MLEIKIIDRTNNSRVGPHGLDRGKEVETQESWATFSRNRPKKVKVAWVKKGRKRPRLPNLSLRNQETAIIFEREIVLREVLEKDAGKVSPYFLGILN